MIQINKCIACGNFPCKDIQSVSHYIPDVNIDPVHVHTLMITEAPPADLNDHLYASSNPFFLQTTLQAFEDAGHSAASLQEIFDRGIYITTALKCAKTGYSVSAETIQNCSEILEKELDLFPNIKAYFLGGDIAIKMFNRICKRKSGERVIPAGSTYKIRHQAYFYKKARVFPSYVMTGKNYLIEKSKRRMIAEDLRAILGS